MREMFDKFAAVWDWFGSTEPFGLYWLLANTLLLGLLWIGVLMASVRLHKRSRSRVVRWPTRAFNWLWVIAAVVLTVPGIIWCTLELAWAGAWLIGPWLFGFNPLLVPGFEPYPPLWLVVLSATSLWVALWAQKETRDRPELGGLPSLLWWTQWPDARHDPNADTIAIRIVKKRV